MNGMSFPPWERNRSKSHVARQEAEVLALKELRRLKRGYNIANVGILCIVTPPE